jgi:hypothetical protein
MAPTSLVAAGNTYNPCLLILTQKGYRLWVEEGEECLLWNAEKAGQSFMAYSPPELLGIVILWEELGENWNRQHPDLISELSH